MLIIHITLMKTVDNNFELVAVWIHYMAGINWMYNGSNYSIKWIATDNGKKRIENIVASDNHNRISYVDVICTLLRKVYI
jgi:hypothetical protein